MDRKRYNEDGVGGMHVYYTLVARQQETGFPSWLPHRILVVVWVCPMYGFGWGMEAMQRHDVPGRDGKAMKPGWWLRREPEG
jgi:hypothetical protein